MFLSSCIFRFTVNIVSRAPRTGLLFSVLVFGICTLLCAEIKSKTLLFIKWSVILRLKLDFQHMQCFILRPRCLTWNGSLAGRYKGRLYSPCWVRFVVEWYKWHPLLWYMGINEVRFFIHLVSKVILITLSLEVTVSRTVQVSSAYKICVAKSWKRRPLGMPGRR